MPHLRQVDEKQVEQEFCGYAVIVIHASKHPSGGAQDFLRFTRIFMFP